MNDAPLAKKREAPGRRISIVLAVAVHVGLAIFLIYGVRWQSERPEAVEVELVQAVPAPPAAEPAPAEPPPAPPQKPAPVVEPKLPPKVEPKPAPAPPKPDIAVKEKEKPKPPPKPEAPAFNPMEMMKRELTQLTQRNTTAAADAELARMKAAQAAAAHDSASKGWEKRIAAKIKGNIVRPANATGNPEAIFEITLLPDGSLVGEPRLKQSTGNAALDNAIERAIRKSDPLPKPEDPSVFQRILLLKFRPLEE
ncbi:MAG: energy transducer TonB [Rhodocyclaceae bacterium]|nr:energy transducer TonB [Rhodocyclaceae bacterium]